LESRTGDRELVATFQVTEPTPGLLATLRDAAAPLPVDVQERRVVPRRVDAVPDPSATAPGVRLDELPRASGGLPPGARVAIEFISDRVGRAMNSALRSSTPAPRW
jgi:hypothetical protein